MADLKAFAEQLVNLTVKEVNELSLIHILIVSLLISRFEQVETEIS